MTTNMDRRLELRKAPETLLTLTLSARDSGQEYYGIVNDLSDGGFGVAVPTRLERGTLVEIFMDNTRGSVFGEVCWCTTDQWLEDCYLLGIKALSPLTH